MHGSRVSSGDFLGTAARCKHGNLEWGCTHCRQTHRRKWRDIAVRYDLATDAVSFECGPEYPEQWPGQSATYIVVTNDSKVLPWSEQPPGEPATVGSLGYDCARMVLQAVADTGFMFLPKYPLTEREMNREGPSHCWNDSCSDSSGKKRIVSFDEHYMGCTSCGYYVCACGNCPCSLPEDAWNYLGQPYPKAGTGIGISADRRALLMQVGRHLAIGIEQYFPDSPLAQGRTPDTHSHVVRWPDEDDAPQ